MKIYCDKCGGTIAHIIGKSMLESVRQGHKSTIAGKDYLAILTCPNTGKCDNKVAITCEDGQILLDNLKLKEESNEKENKDSNDGGAEIIDEGKDGEGSPSETPEPAPEPTPELDTTKSDGSGGDDGSSGDSTESKPEGEAEATRGSDSEGGTPITKEPSVKGSGDESPTKERKYTRL